MKVGEIQMFLSKAQAGFLAYLYTVRAIFSRMTVTEDKSALFYQNCMNGK